MQVLVLYGSQTGTARDIGWTIAQELCDVYSNVKFASLDQISFLDFLESKIVIFVCSTCGDGECPWNMTLFWGKLRQKSLMNVLSACKIAILGLGDSTYPKFNSVARMLNVRLHQLGATDLCPIGLADDRATGGLFSVYSIWREQLYLALPTVVDLASNISDSAPYPRLYNVELADRINDIPVYCRANEGCNHYCKIEVQLRQTRRLTSDSWSQVVNHMEFDILNVYDGSISDILPGDVASFFPANRPELVDNALNYLNMTGEEMIRIQRLSDFPSPFDPLADMSCSVKDLLVHYLDIDGTPQRSFFYRLWKFINCAVDESQLELLNKLKEMCSKEGNYLYLDYCVRERRNYIEILNDFIGLREFITIREFVDLIPPMRPREYSLSSSPKLHVNSIHLCVAIVDYLTPYKRRIVGTCSSYLMSLTDHVSRLDVWLKRGVFSSSSSSSMLASPRPLVLIGPGTGIAPLLSIALDRFSSSPVLSEVLIVFGNRHEQMDYLYKEELELMRNNEFAKLLVCFSRDFKEKRYVTHLIRENSEIISTLVSQNAIILISGSNSNKMPSDVRRALCDVLGDNEVKILEKQKRILVEAWG